MTEKQTNVITIDDKEYDVDTFTDVQRNMLNHITDLDRKINNALFNLDQLQVGKAAFAKELKDSLEDQSDDGSEAAA
jgi:hypothetical protein